MIIKITHLPLSSAVEVVAFQWALKLYCPYTLVSVPVCHCTNHQHTNCGWTCPTCKSRVFRRCLPKRETRGKNNEERKLSTFKESKVEMRRKTIVKIVLKIVINSSFSLIWTFVLFLFVCLFSLFVCFFNCKMPLKDNI